MWEKMKRRSSSICSIAAILLITAIVLTASLNQNAVPAVSSEITNWGLSFQTEGAPPTGNASAEYLKKYRSVYYAPVDDKVIYLTFDAGFENGNMPSILETLKKHNVKATFFLVGHFLESEPDLVRQMAADGHSIGNHTYSHPDMAAITNANAFREELQKNEALYQEITGTQMPHLYRPPQGKYSESNLALASEMAYDTVFWSLAYVDWQQEQQPSAEEAFSKLIPRIHPGAIVLLHSTSSTNAQILDELLTKWTELGYHFGDLEAYLASEIR